MDEIKTPINPATIELLLKIMSGYSSIREFARCIGEDAMDVMRWRKGKRKINPRAVISICRLHNDIDPWQLNPAVFPDNLTLKFKERKR